MHPPSTKIQYVANPSAETYDPITPAIPHPVTLHLVGHSPLEAHHLWNGSRVVAQHFEEHPELVRDRTVLELGAGAGLPSLVAACLGGRRVVVTDFPDPDLVQNMWKNIYACPSLNESGESPEGRIIADGYVWGADPSKLLSHLSPSQDEKFDVLILADLLFRHAEHGKLVDSIEMCMKVSEESQALVVFTSYRPWLQHKDLKFFDLARERGFEVEKVLVKMMDKPLFENDTGDEEVRKTVTGWVVKWPKAHVEGRMDWPKRGESGSGDKTE